jgi:predicted CXXCH cytochrome family protein
MRKLSAVLSLFAIVVFLLSGCTEPVGDGLPGSDSDNNTYHSEGWKDNPQHGSDYSGDPVNCEACHGEDLDGGTSGISCAGCHHGWSGTHADAFNEDPGSCQGCHGDSIASCADCHHNGWAGTHVEAFQEDPDSCKTCHNGVASCTDCHQSGWTDSAHGNTSYGVDRSGTGTEGDCTHCHDPSGPYYELMLFAPMNQTGRTDNFCLQCHTDTGSVQVGGIVNSDYSGTFGGASGGVAGIKEAFAQLSYHNLSDVLNFTTGEWPSTFTGDSNACSACHNVHSAKRNKENPGDPTYAAISRPSDHDNLWGDGDPDERMTAAGYGDYYQPPYHTSPNLEPDGAGSDRAIQAGKTPDYVTFCTDCHNSSNAINSTVLGRPLKTIDWSSSGDKHGRRDMDEQLDIAAPYGSAGCNVLSCLDCHEPHGSSNIMLIRGEVNGGALAGLITNYTSDQWYNLCEKCHAFPAGATPQERNLTLHHSLDESDGVTCLQKCHSYSGSLACTDCHYHGSIVGDAPLLDRVTF